MRRPTADVRQDLADLRLPEDGPARARDGQPVTAPRLVPRPAWRRCPRQPVAVGRHVSTTERRKAFAVQAAGPAARLPAARGRAGRRPTPGQTPATTPGQARRPAASEPTQPTSASGQLRAGGRLSDPQRRAVPDLEQADSSARDGVPRPSPSSSASLQTTTDRESRRDPNRGPSRASRCGSTPAVFVVSSIPA